MLSKLVNNGPIGEERLGRRLAVEPGPTFSDARNTFQVNWRNGTRRLAMWRTYL